MGKLIDETGNMYGYLTVLNQEQSVDGVAMWRCRCKCGNICIVPGTSLRTGNTKSCGCYQKNIVSKIKYKDLTGLHIGRLTVLRNTGDKKNGKYVWECSCSCGQLTYVTSDRLISGNPKSCGCLRREMASKNQTKDLIGKQFDRLTVKEKIGINKRHQMEWLCDCICGNHKVATSVDLIHGKVTSCGCNKSTGEQLVQSWLEQHNIAFEKEKRFSNCKAQRPLPFDFYLPQYNICIEYDGVQHYEEVKQFARRMSLEDRQKRDEIKTQYCNDNGINLIRIPYWEKDNIESILSEWLNIDCAEETHSSSVDLSA